MMDTSKNTESLIRSSLSEQDENGSPSESEIHYISVKKDGIGDDSDSRKRVKFTQNNKLKIRRDIVSPNSSAGRPTMYTISLKNGKISGSKPINPSGEQTRSLLMKKTGIVNKNFSQGMQKSYFGKIPQYKLKTTLDPQKVQVAQEHGALTHSTERNMSGPTIFSGSPTSKPVAIRSMGSSAFETDSDDSSHSKSDSLDIPNLNNIEIIDASDSDDEMESQRDVKVDVIPEMNVTQTSPEENKYLIDSKSNSAPKVIPPLQPLSTKTSYIIPAVLKKEQQLTAKRTVTAPAMKKSGAPLITTTATVPTYSRVINKTINTSVKTAPSSNANTKSINVTSNVTNEMCKNSISDVTKHVNIKPKSATSPLVAPGTTAVPATSLIVPPNPINFNLVIPKSDIIRCKQSNTPLILAFPPTVPLNNSSTSNTTGSNLVMLMPHQFPSNLQGPGVVNFLVSNLEKKSGPAIQLPVNTGANFLQTTSLARTNTTWTPPQQRTSHFLSNAVDLNMSQGQSLLKSANVTSHKENIVDLTEDSSVDKGPKILNTREKDGPSWCWYAPKFGKRDLEGFLYRDRLGFSKSDVIQSKRCLRKLNIFIYKKQEELDQLAAQIIRTKRGFKTIHASNKRSRDIAPYKMNTNKEGKDISPYKIRLTGLIKGKRGKPEETLKEMIDSKKIKLVELPFLNKSEEDNISSTKSLEKEPSGLDMDENESDLYYTKKVVILKNRMPLRRRTKKIGRLPKIKLRASQEMQHKSKKQQLVPSSLKQCQVVLERDEKIEEKIKGTFESKTDDISDVRSSRKRKLDLESMGLIKKVRRRNAIDSPVASVKSKEPIEELSYTSVTKPKKVTADITDSDEYTRDINRSDWDSERLTDPQSTTQKSTQTGYKKSVFMSYREYQKISKLSQAEIKFVFTLNTIQVLQDLKINESKPILLLDQFNYQFDFDTINNYNVLFTRDDDEPIPAPLLKNLELVYFVRCGYIKVVSRPVICKYILERCDMNKLSGKKSKESANDSVENKSTFKTSFGLGTERKTNIAKENFAKHLSLRRKFSEKKKVWTKKSDDISKKSGPSSRVVKKVQAKLPDVKGKNDSSHRLEEIFVGNTTELPCIEDGMQLPSSNVEGKSDILDKKFIEIEKNLSEMFDKPGHSLNVPAEYSVSDDKRKIIEKPESEATPSLEDLFVNSSDESTNSAPKIRLSKECSKEHAIGSKHSEMPITQSELQETCEEQVTGEHIADNLVKLLVSTMDDSGDNSKFQAQTVEKEKPDTTIIEFPGDQVCHSTKSDEGVTEHIDVIRSEGTLLDTEKSKSMVNPVLASDSSENFPAENSGSIPDDDLVTSSVDAEYSSEIHIELDNSQEGKAMTSSDSPDDYLRDNIPVGKASINSELLAHSAKSKTTIDTEIIIGDKSQHSFDKTESLETDIDRFEEKEEREQADLEVVGGGKQSDVEILGEKQEDTSKSIVQVKSEKDEGIVHLKGRDFLEPGDELNIHSFRQSDTELLGEKQKDTSKSILQVKSGKDERIHSKGRDFVEPEDDLNIPKEKYCTELDVEQFLLKDPESNMCSDEAALDVDQFLNKNNEGVIISAEDTDEINRSELVTDSSKATVTDSDLQAENVSKEEFTVIDTEREMREESVYETRDVISEIQRSEPLPTEVFEDSEPSASGEIKESEPLASVEIEELKPSAPGEIEKLEPSALGYNISIVKPESSVGMKDMSSEDVLETTKDVDALHDESLETEHISLQTKDGTSEEPAGTDCQSMVDTASKMEIFEHASSPNRAEANVSADSLVFEQETDPKIADISASLDTEEQLLSSCDLDADLAIRSDEISKDLPDDYLEK